MLQSPETPAASLTLESPLVSGWTSRTQEGPQAVTGTTQGGYASAGMGAGLREWVCNPSQVAARPAQAQSSCDR